MKAAFEVADVLNTHWTTVQHSGRFNSWQLRTMDAVKRCSQRINGWTYRWLFIHAGYYV